jgi:hypothetical protein
VDEHQKGRSAAVSGLQGIPPELGTVHIYLFIDTYDMTKGMRYCTSICIRGTIGPERRRLMKTNKPKLRSARKLPNYGQHTILDTLRVAVLIHRLPFDAVARLKPPEARRLIETFDNTIPSKD